MAKKIRKPETPSPISSNDPGTWESTFPIRSINAAKKLADVLTGWSREQTRIYGQGRRNIIPEGILETTPELRQGVLVVLYEQLKAFQRGGITDKERPLSRKNLVRKLREKGYIPENWSYQQAERKTRKAMEELHKFEGYPICSTSGKNGGYWYAANDGEKEMYIARELIPRVKTLVIEIWMLVRTPWKKPEMKQLSLLEKPKAR